MSTMPFVPTPPSSGGIKIAGRRVPVPVVLAVIAAVGGLLFLRSRQSRAAAAQAAAQASPLADPGYSASGGALAQLESGLASLQSQVSQIASYGNGAASAPIFAAPAPAASAPVGTAATDPATQLFTGLYSTVLGRAADPGGLAYWTGRAQSEGTALAVSGFTNAPEALGALVQGAYQKDLHRAADAPGLAYWTGFLQSGHTAGELDAQLQASKEARALQATPGR